MKYLLFLILIFSNLLYSQPTSPSVELHESIIPRPFNKAFYKDYNDYSKIESITKISSKSYDGFDIDTVGIKYYNERGQLYKAIYYNENKPENTYITSFDEEGNNIKLKSFSINSQNYEVTDTYYDSNGRLNKMKSYKVISKRPTLDTIQRGVATFKYENDFLVERINTGKGITENFTYNEEGFLIQQEGRFQPYQYFYNELGLLTRFLIFHTKLKPENLYHEKRFQYDDRNRLILDSIFVSNSLGTKDIYVTRYEYNNQDQLIRLYDSFGDKYREVEFKYDDQKIIENKVITNGNSGHFKFPFFVNLIEYTFPVEIIDQIEYDQFGNRINHIRTVNGKLNQVLKTEIKYKD